MLLYLVTLFSNCSFDNIEIGCGQYVDGESLVSLKYFFLGVGSQNVVYNNVSNSIRADFRENYLWNILLAFLGGIKVILLIGTNPRLESPLLNLKLREDSVEGRVFLSSYSCVYSYIYSLGLSLNYISYLVKNLSNSISILLCLTEGKHQFCQGAWSSIPISVIFLGISLLERFDNFSIWDTFHFLFFEEFVSFFSVIHTVFSRILPMDLGFIPGISSSFVLSSGMPHGSSIFIYESKGKLLLYNFD